MEKLSVYRNDVTNGMLGENPTFVQLIGMCPVLAVTTMVTNAIAMALATTFVLCMSSVFVSILKKFINPQTRMVVFVVVIASFVAIADMFLAAFFPAQSKILGPFVPLIVVNCIIIARAEVFAVKHSVFRSFLDGFGMGMGFFIGVLSISMG